MRSLKRVLSLALVLVMVLSMVTVASAAVATTYAEITDKDSVKNKLAVSLLVDLGVINGYDDGSFRPANEVTRAEFTKLATYFLVGEAAGKAMASATANSSYGDVLNSSAVWAAGYIEYLTDQGCIAGKGDKKFDPLANVTAQEAAKILITAIGYDADKEGLTGPNWALRTNVIANNLGLYDGYDGAVDKALTRDEAAQIIYNALKAAQVVLNANTGNYDYKNREVLNTSGTVAYTAAAASTRLYELNLVAVTGYLVGNEYADIGGFGTVTTGSRIVTDLTTGATVNPAIDSTVGQLGAQVSYYTNRAGKVISSYVAETGKTLAVATNDAGTNYNAMKSSANGGLTYAATVDVYANNAAAVEIDTINATNVNGLTTASGTPAPAAAYTPARGKIVTYYDMDGDGKVDTINVVTYTFSKVTATKAATSSAEATITVTGLSGKGGLTSNTIASGYVANGFDSVAKDDYVLYYAANGYVIDIQKAPVKTGSMTAVSSNYIRIDGAQTYVSGIGLTSGVLDTVYAQIALNTAATFYMDFSGNVVAATADTAAAANYLYVLAAEVAYNPGGLVSAANTFIALKVILSDGTQKIIDVALSTASDGTVYLTGGHAGTYANSTSTTTTDPVNPTLMSTIYGTPGNAATAAAKFVGNIYSYAVNSNGAYVIAGTASNVAALNTVTPVTGATTATATIKKNQATIGNITAANGVANSSTVLAFTNTAKNALNIAYTGIANFPSYSTAATVKAVVDAAGRIVFAVVEAPFTSTQVDGYAIYIGQAETTTAGTYHTLLINGTKTDVLIDGTTPSADGVYSYIVNSGTYTLTSVAAAGTNAAVVLVDNAYVVVGISLVYFADSYAVYDATTTPKYGDASLASGQTATYYVDGDSELVIAVITVNP